MCFRAGTTRCFFHSAAEQAGSAADPMASVEAAAAVVSDHDVGLFAARYRPFTIAILAMMGTFGFEGVGLATAMPKIARALDGLAMYSWGFNAYVIAGLVAMAMSGGWCDRYGPRMPILVGIVLFSVGAVLAGLAWSMPVFVVARLVQGLGGGTAFVAVYVIIGRAYPEKLRPRAFSLLAIAWAGASIVGPSIAGALADHVSWRVVLLVVPPLVIPAVLVLAGKARGLSTTIGAAQQHLGRLGAALLAAGGLLMVQEAGMLRDPRGAVFAVGGGTLLVLGLHRLLPRGTLKLARGLPTVVMLRGMLGGVFFAGEAFIPLAAQTVRGLSSIQAGLGLTAGAIAWAIGAQLQGRLYERASSQAFVQTGAALVAIAMLTMPLSLLQEVPVWLFAVSWFLGSTGMGMCFASMSTLTFALSAPQDQGANSAALQVCDSAGTVLFVSAAGAVYGAAVSSGTESIVTFTTIWLSAGFIAAVCIVLGARIGQP